MTDIEKRGRAQYKISQERIDGMAAWLNGIFPETRDKLIQDFMDVYNQMLSSLDINQKSAPANLYKLDSYWELQKSAKETLQALGEKINTQGNEQLRLVYIEIYEGCYPGKERICTVSEKTIQSVINQARGKVARTSQERTWFNLTILWDRLFGDLMQCTLKRLPAKTLLLKLQEEFNTTFDALKVSFSDSATYVQARAAARRGRDDYKDEIALASGNTSEEDAPIMATMSLRAMSDEGGDGDSEDEESLGFRVYVYTEDDDLTCPPCKDLEGILWDEDKWGPVPVPVHPHCRCWIEFAFPNPFDEMADAVGGAGILGLLLGGVLTIMGMMWDDLMSGGMTPGAWLSKWGGKYPV